MATTLKIINSGGACSQLSALATGLFLKQKFDVNFELVFLDHDMSHTSGFLLAPLLRDGETFTSESVLMTGKNRGDRLWKHLPKSFRIHLNPLRRGYEKVGQAINYLVISRDNMREEVIQLRYMGDIRSLRRVSGRVSAITGNFWPGLISEVGKELGQRFIEVGWPNIFDSSPTNLSNTIAIHYRLGDMRTNPNYQISHGVMSPTSLASVVSKIRRKVGEDIPLRVFSDEPEIARICLQKMETLNWTISSPQNIWLDIQSMLESRFFIGSFSTVSMTVAEIHANILRKTSFLPTNARHHKIGRKQNKVNYFSSKILPIDHEIYQI